MHNSEAVLERLSALLQPLLHGVSLRRRFDGVLPRSLTAPVLCLDIQTESTGENAVLVLSVTLYLPRKSTAADLFSAVCRAAEQLPGRVQSVVRGESRFHEAMQCLVIPCTVRLADAVGEGKSIGVNGTPCRVAGVSVECTGEIAAYGSVGEAAPHTVRRRNTRYKITLQGISDTAALLQENLILTIDGAAYGPCALKTVEGNSAVFVTGTRREGGI